MCIVLVVNVYLELSFPVGEYEKAWGKTSGNQAPECWPTPVSIYYPAAGSLINTRWVTTSQGSSNLSKCPQALVTSVLHGSRPAHAENLVYRERCLALQHKSDSPPPCKPQGLQSPSSPLRKRSITLRSPGH